MTVSSHPHSSMLNPSETTTTVERAAQAGSDWKVWAMLVAGIGAIYLLMLNPYWVPGGDSELYVAVARSWATGLRHTFNGTFVSICPPGWPLVLAAAMKISPSFLFLKLITIACMTFALGLWYWLLLRFTTRKQAAMVTLLTAIISHVYTLSFWMHSDALFCLLATGAMVLACQINEGRPRIGWRIAAMVALCVAMQLVRWAGMLQWLVVAGLLVRGYRLSPATAWLYWVHKRVQWGPWLALVLSFVITCAAFFTVRHALRLTPEQENQAKEAGATFDEQQQPQAPQEARTVDIVNKPNAKTTLAQELIKRSRDAGKWFSWLVWPELRFVGGVRLLSSLDTILGWILLVPIVVAGFYSLRRFEWASLGMALYCFYLCLNWPNPNARYLVPILPALLWGMIEGTRLILRNRPRLAAGTVSTLLWSIVLANLLLLSVDVCIARSNDFYGYYEGGLDQSLISSVKYLSDSRGISDGELAVSEVYTNLGRRRISKFGLRATVMLADRIVKNVPGKFGDDVLKRNFLRWSRSRHMKFYLYQQPISPWRLWHFRLPPLLQQKLSGEEVPPESGGWVLYRYVAPVNATIPLPIRHVVTLQPAKWVKIDVPIVHDWPKRVPGM